MGRQRPPLRFNNAAAGCHRVKVDCWTGIFKHGVVYDGPVKVRAGGETRFFARAGTLALVGFTDLQPAAPQISREQLDDATDYLKDAIELNRDSDSACADRVAGKLEALQDLLKDFASGNGDLKRVLAKLDDTSSLVSDECPRRQRDSLNKKLSKISRRLSGR